MPQTAHGQHADRPKRIQRTEEWLGAQHVEAGGIVKEASPRGLDPQQVENEVNAIRQSLQSGVAKVRMDISCPHTIKAIKELLTPEELAKVQFGSEEFPAA